MRIWTRKKLIFAGAGFLAFVLVISGGFYFRGKYSENGEIKSQADVFVRFEMEAYDKIIRNYWMRVPESDLASLFELAIEKAASTTAELKEKDRAGTAEMLAHVFEKATSTDAKKRLALDTLVIVLYNLQPVGREGILSTAQETAFRENVSNINPASDLYQNLGLAKGASMEEIETSYESKRANLATATAPGAKAELEKAAYAYKVLKDGDSKKLYDEAKIEPTIFTRVLGTALYVNMTKVSPTTLSEFGKAVIAAPKETTAMIIDMRGNIGGSLDFVQAFLGLFIGQNQYAFDLYAKDEFRPQRTTLPRAVELKQYKEIAILTDEMTQSSAEILSAAFKRFGLGKVIGKTTRGWGTIENTYPLETAISPDEKYSLLLVNHITLRDDNQPIEGRGVDPDIDTGAAGWQNKLADHFRSKSLISAIKDVSSKPPLR